MLLRQHFLRLYSVGRFVRFAPFDLLCDHPRWKRCLQNSEWCHRLSLSLGIPEVCGNVTIQFRPSCNWLKNPEVIRLNRYCPWIGGVLTKYSISSVAPEYLVSTPQSTDKIGWACFQCYPTTVNEYRLYNKAITKCFVKRSKGNKII